MEQLNTTDQQLAPSPTGPTSRPRRPAKPPRPFYRPPRQSGSVYKSHLRRSGVRYLFLAPAVLYLLSLFAYPIFYNVFISVQKYSAISFIQNSGQFNGVANYVGVFEDPNFIHVIIDTVAFVGFSLAFQFGIGLALAVFFSRKFPLNTFLRTLILVPWLLPPLVSGTVLKFMFQTQSGMVNRVLTGVGIVSQPIQWLSTAHMALFTVILASIWIGIPFNMVLLYSGIQEIPTPLFEAARVDGAGGLRIFWNITLPMLRNVSAVVVLLGIIYTTKAFDQIYVMTGGGPANATQVLSTWSYTLSFLDNNFGQGAAVGNLMIGISLVCAFIYIRLYGRTALS